MAAVNSTTNATAFQFTPESLISLLNYQTTLAVFVVSFVISRIVTFVRGLKLIGNVPGLRCAFEPYSLPGALIPTNSWNPGVNFAWLRRLDFYQSLGGETISIIPFLWGKPILWTSNLDVARQVVQAGPQSAWFKPIKFSQALLFFGMNLGGAEGGEQWRRHRRIMGPAFNNRTYTLVWNETMRVYRDMVTREGWGTRDMIDIPVIQKYTFKMALFVISACGFGIPFKWDEPPVGPDGRMSIQEALRVVSDSNFIRVASPKWLFSLPIKKYQECEEAHHTLQAFMKGQVATRKAEIRQELAMGEGEEDGRSDVFSRLVRANESAAEKLPLDDEELIGNVFVLLFAGHETSGHTLAATLGFLAVYQEEQEIIYEQIMSVVGRDRDPTFEDYPALYKVLSAFYEALRLIPAGAVMIREAARDTILTLPDANEGPATKQPMTKGSIVIVDVVGIQYNPRYFPEPNAFRPSRWYAQESSNEPDAFTAFSIGPRACIGRKFATTEAVCFLALMLRDWHVDVILQNGETREQWRERVLQAQMIMTLAVNDVPVKLTRRTKA